MPKRPPSRVRSVAWLLLAVVLGLLFVLNVVGTVIAVARHIWTDLLTAPFVLVFFYWTSIGAWRRTRWCARRRAARAEQNGSDPVRRFDARAILVLLLPGWLFWYPGHKAADRLVALRSITLVMSLALFLFAGTLSRLPGLPYGPVFPWLAIVAGFAACTMVSDRWTATRKLDCSSNETLAKAYTAQVQLRLVLAESVGLMAFAGAVIGGPAWIYYPGAAFSLVRIWTGIVPTDRMLARDQRALASQGCERSLVDALRRSPVVGPQVTDESA